MPKASARFDQVARQGASVTIKPLWRPTIGQMEIIAQLSIARAPVETIARDVGLSPRAFRAWRQRCMNAAASEAAKPAPLPPIEPIRVEKSRADRAIAAHFR
jgi:hypothetical protein